MSTIIYFAAALLFSSCARGDNSTATVTTATGTASNTTTTATGDTCGLQPVEGPWSAALEDWVTSERVAVGRHGNARTGRIMLLPSTHGYYVSERIDLMSPPPPPHPHGTHGTHGTHGPHNTHHMHHRGPYPAHHSAGPYHGPPESPNSRLQNQPGPPKAPAAPSAPQGSAPAPYDEWQATPPSPPGAGKIVNRPPNPYKDQFKPSYPPPQHPIPVQGGGGLSDRVDEARPPPHKLVSETDLYLLGAIEKLVYRVDLMEKRLRKMEENLHYLVAGTEAKPEPCQANFTRVGGVCYHVSSDALNWKSANYACRKLQGHLLELAADQRRGFTSGLLADKNLKGSDFWTGGLNPGLLWIWSHSAKAVGNATEDSTSIVGEGRCLALVHDPTVASYVYRGQDCALRHRYVCEKNEDKTRLGNEIERVAREMRGIKRGLKRIPKMKGADELRVD